MHHHIQGYAQENAKETSRENLSSTMLPIRPWGYKTVFMLNLAEQEIYPIINVNDWLWCFKLKFPLVLATSVFASSLNFMLN